MKNETNNGCGKYVYASERMANEVVNWFKKQHNTTKLGQRMNRDLGNSDKKLKRSYYCPQCNGWHVTSTPKTYKNKGAQWKR